MSNQNNSKAGLGGLLTPDKCVVLLTLGGKAK
jgi:hypothetical protein